MQHSIDTARHHTELKGGHYNLFSLVNVALLASQKTGHYQLK